MWQSFCRKQADIARQKALSGAPRTECPGAAERVELRIFDGSERRLLF